MPFTVSSLGHPSSAAATDFQPSAPISLPLRGITEHKTMPFQQALRKKSEGKNSLKHFDRAI
jgi:hypothetical protein